MNLQELCNEIQVDSWRATAALHAAEGYRLVHMSGTARDDHFEIMAAYDKDYHCVNYRITVPREDPELPSISDLFGAAFTYENELKDLFGFRIPGLLVDYGGKFLRTKTKLPFSGKVEHKKAPDAVAGSNN